MKRGEVVICVSSGEYGKARPAIVVQNDVFNDVHPSITVCPITSCLENARLVRIKITPSKKNGLKKTSQVMVDKMQPIRRDKIRQRVGELTAKQMESIDQAVRLWLDLPNIS